MDYSTEDLELFRAIAENDSLQKPLEKDRARLMYRPLYKHPLSSLGAKHSHEEVLRRLLVIPRDKQVVAAISLGDAWCLEECYMRGASTFVTDQCGVTPLHLAARLDNVDCCMVLVNSIVDIDSVSLDGMTPLGLAIAAGSRRVTAYLRTIGARESVARVSRLYTAASTVLEIDTERKHPSQALYMAHGKDLPSHHYFG